MQPKRFTGSSVRAVMAEVREALGRDALILEQQQTGSVVEMLATVQIAPDVTKTSSARSAPAKPRRSRAKAPKTDSTLRLHEQRLRAVGFTDSVIGRLPVALDNWRATMSALLDLIDVSERLPTAAIVKVTGPSSAGITSSLIKYAVHMLRCGKDPKRMRIVHCGPVRLGSSEPLLLAGQMLGIPVLQQTAEQAARSLHNAHPETLILADCSILEPELARGSILNDPLIQELELLVIPAHWQPEILTQWLDIYASASTVRRNLQCMVTNIDRLSSWGGWLSLLVERHWSLALLSNGPRLPDDLQQPRKEWLEQRLLDQIDRFRPATKVNAGDQAVEH